MSFEPCMVDLITPALCGLQGSRVREDPGIGRHHPGAFFPLFLAIPDPGRDIDLSFLGIAGIGRYGVMDKWRGFPGDHRQTKGRGGGDSSRRNNESATCD